MILPNPQPRIDPEWTPHVTSDESNVDAILAHLRSNQLEAAKQGRILESAEYANRAHRLAAHLTRSH